MRPRALDKIRETEINKDLKPPEFPVTFVDETRAGMARVLTRPEKQRRPHIERLDLQKGRRAEGFLKVVLSQAKNFGKTEDIHDDKQNRQIERILEEAGGLIRNGNIFQAITLLKRGIRTFPNHPFLLLKLHEIARELSEKYKKKVPDEERFEVAIEYCEFSYELYPEDLYVVLALANILSRSGSIERAFQLIEDARCLAHDEGGHRKLEQVTDRVKKRK